jgi:hypothetical protein
MKEGVYERFMRHSATLVPIGLAGTGLITLITFRLARPVSDELNKTLSYVELFLSFGASLMILIYMGGLFTTLLRQMLRGLAFNGMLIFFMIYALLGLLLNPFALTVLRVALEDKIDDMKLSLGILVSTCASLLFTWVLFVGTRGGR